MIRRCFVLFFSGFLLLATGCGKKPAPAPVALDPATQKQMDLLMEAIATVQSNYVDETKVSSEPLIANTIRGMIEPVDPKAKVIPVSRQKENQRRPSIHQADAEAVVNLKIPGFDESIRKSLRRMEGAIRRARAAGILMDLRGSTGYDYETALTVLNWFLPYNSVAGSLVRKNEPPRVLNTRKKPIVKPDIRLVVLIDEKTEDAGEWIAAALKHHQRAVLVGRSTKGLGLIRQPVSVTEDWVILMTAGTARTPDGTTLEGAPVQPDVLLKPWADDELIYRTGLRQLAALPEIIKSPAD